MKCNFMQKRGWKYLIGGPIVALLAIGSVMGLDMFCGNPYYGNYTCPEDPEENTSCTTMMGDDGMIIVQIAPNLENCTGAGPRQCMLIRHLPTTDNGRWDVFCGGIEGFTYEEGYRWTIVVNVTEVENPPADAPGLRYELAEVVEKVPVSL